MNGDLPESEQKTITSEATGDGLCVGVLQWIQLYMDKETVFENRPADRFAPSAWCQRLFPFAEPLHVRCGEEVSFRPVHNIASLAFDRERSHG